MPSTSQQLESNNSLNGSFQLNEEFDSGFYADMPDLDIFGLFPPSFDLHTVDAHLEGNLNLGCPTML